MNRIIIGIIFIAITGFSCQVGESTGDLNNDLGNQGSISLSFYQPDIFNDLNRADDSSRMITADTHYIEIICYDPYALADPIPTTEVPNQTQIEAIRSATGTQSVFLDYYVAGNNSTTISGLAAGQYWNLVIGCFPRDHLSLEADDTLASVPDWSSSEGGPETYAVQKNIFINRRQTQTVNLTLALNLASLVHPNHEAVAPQTGSFPTDGTVDVTLRTNAGGYYTYSLFGTSNNPDTFIMVLQNLTGATASFNHRLYLNYQSAYAPPNAAFSQLEFNFYNKSGTLYNSPISTNNQPSQDEYWEFAITDSTEWIILTVKGNGGLTLPSTDTLQLSYYSNYYYNQLPVEEQYMGRINITQIPIQASVNLILE